MARIRVPCRNCPTPVELLPGQLLVVPGAGAGSFSFLCPTCGRVSDGPAGPDQLLLLAAAGAHFDSAHPSPREQS